MTIIDETTVEEADKPSYDYYGTSMLGDATSTTTTTTTTSTSTTSTGDVFHRPTATIATLVDDADNVNDFYSTAENNTNNSNKLPTAFENPYDDPDISIASADTDDDDLDDGMNIDDDAMTKNEDDDSPSNDDNNNGMRENIRKIVCTPAGITGIVLVLFVIIVAIAGAIKSDEDHDSSSYYNDNDHNYYSSSQTMYGTDDYLGSNNNSEAYLNATSNNRNDTDTYRSRGGGARTTSHGIFYVRRPSSGRVGGGGSSAGRLGGTAGGTSYGGRGGTSSSGSSSSGGGGGSCFPAGQQVLLEGQREQVPIEKVRPGSVLHLGGRVAAVMKLPALLDEDPLYSYNDSVLVTGSHLVNEKGDWMPVEKSQLAVPLYGDHDGGSAEPPPPPPKFVYNLITANHRMVVNNATVFSDWEEWEDCEENWGLERRILDRLNNNNNPGRRFVDARRPTASSRSAIAASAAAITNDDGTAITEGAFSSDTPVLLHNGTTVPIQNIEPGDRLYNDDPEGLDRDEGKNNRVFAVMKLWVPKNTKMYRYRNSKRNVSVTVTEWTIVLDDDGIWRNAKYSSNSELVGKTAGSRRGGGTAASEDNWYQLWTTTHRVPVTAAGVLFADYHVIDEDDPIFAEQC